MDPPATADPAAGSPSSTSSSLRRRAALSVNTSAPGDSGRVMEREGKMEAEREVEPVSPAGRLFREAHFNCYIVALLGLGAPVDVAATRAGLEATLVRHPRFCSVQGACRSSQYRRGEPPDIPRIYGGTEDEAYHGNKFNFAVATSLSGDQRSLSHKNPVPASTCRKGKLKAGRRPSRNK